MPFGYGTLFEKEPRSVFEISVMERRPEKSRAKVVSAGSISEPFPFSGAAGSYIECTPYLVNRKILFQDPAVHRRVFFGAGIAFAREAVFWMVLCLRPFFALRKHSRDAVRCKSVSTRKLVVGHPTARK